MNQFFNSKDVNTNDEADVLKQIYKGSPSLEYEDRWTESQLRFIIKEAMYYQRVACGRVYRENKDNHGFNEFDLYNATIVKGDLNGI